MRKIAMMVVPLIVACALLLPAISSAATPTPCVETCLTRSQAVKVTLLPEEFTGAIRLPLLPKGAKVYNRIEREYYVKLHEISNDVCQQSLEAHEKTGVTAFTGFASQLVQFKTVRQFLNRLLSRYGRGLGPTIEDFSGVNRIIYPFSRVEEIGSATGMCKFELV